MADQKEQWKKDSNQLKEDLKSREKIVKKREVQIKVGKPGTPSSKKQAATQQRTSLSSPFIDEQRRRELGLM
ncbi:hypothetical protein HOH45_01495 [bacterium]|jgi:hypothetical protein|nr:hypothetical protein [bacterium]